MSTYERKEGPDEPNTAERAELTRIDERELRLRLFDALDRFLDLGFAVHFIAVKGRTSVEYRLALYPDGAESVPSSAIQEVADEFRLDYTVDRDAAIDGWTILLYPRW